MCLKAIILAIISTIIFFFIRDYGFALFSVTGAPESVFYIALAAIIIIPFNEVSVMSEKCWMEWERVIMNYSLQLESLSTKFQ